MSSSTSILQATESKQNNVIIALRNGEWVQHEDDDFRVHRPTCAQEEYSRAINGFPEGVVKSININTRAPEGDIDSFPSKEDRKFIGKLATILVFVGDKFELKPLVHSLMPLEGALCIIVTADESIQKEASRLGHHFLLPPTSESEQADFVKKVYRREGLLQLKPEEFKDELALQINGWEHQLHAQNRSVTDERQVLQAAILAAYELAKYYRVLGKNTGHTYYSPYLSSDYWGRVEKFLLRRSDAYAENTKRIKLKWKRAFDALGQSVIDAQKAGKSEAEIAKIEKDAEEIAAQYKVLAKEEHLARVEAEIVRVRELVAKGDTRPLREVSWFHHRPRVLVQDQRSSSFYASAGKAGSNESKVEEKKRSVSEPKKPSKS